jgi:predicted TIM-barrel fold metal-dependent hydrolase
VIVFADGGFDLLWPLLWRLDKDWRGNRDEVPAAALAPGEYLRDHVRFILHRFEGPAAREARRDWLSASAGAEDLLLYGSNAPQWDIFSAQDAADCLPEPMRERVLRRNAEAIYSIREEHRGP